MDKHFVTSIGRFLSFCQDDDDCDNRTVFCQQRGTEKNCVFCASTSTTVLNWQEK